MNEDISMIARNGIGRFEGLRLAVWAPKVSMAKDFINHTGIVTVDSSLNSKEPIILIGDDFKYKLSGIKTIIIFMLADYNHDLYNFCKVRNYPIISVSDWR